MIGVVFSRDFYPQVIGKCIINVNPLWLYYINVRYFTFTALHWMQGGQSGERCPSVGLSFCLSVRLSVKRVDFDKTEESSAQIFLPYEKIIRNI